MFPVQVLLQTYMENLRGKMDAVKTMNKHGRSVTVSDGVTKPGTAVSGNRPR